MSCWREWIKRRSRIWGFGGAGKLRLGELLVMFRRKRKESRGGSCCQLAGYRLKLMRSKRGMPTL